MLNLFGKDKEPKDIKTVLTELKNLKKQVDLFSKELDKLKNSSEFHIQKVGVVRFNPFPGAGGNQSFSIAVLDGRNDGFVLTSLYGREANRVYGKAVKNCASEHPLSNEEKEAIAKAITLKS